MKKYFVTSIFTAAFFSVSLLSCTKDVTGVSNPDKVNSVQMSNIIKKTIITQDDSVVVKKINLQSQPGLQKPLKN